MSRGTVAAGHPDTAAAGVWALREGGNAVDAAIAAVCASLSAESPLTGLGAGGYMLIHEPGGEGVLLDFFVAAPGRDERERRSELVPVEVDFGGTTQIFNVGAASCGVPGTPAGLDEACRLFGSMPLAELVRPGVRLAREGVPITRQQGYIISILAPILTHQAEGAEIYAPEGSLLREGGVFHAPELAETLELLGEEGAEPFYHGEIGDRICAWVIDRGGRLSREDMLEYRPAAREPVKVAFNGHQVLTNPPPSSGGLLIAFALAVLERLQRVDVESVVTVMDQAQAARTPDFLAGLYSEDFTSEFLTEDAVAEAVRRCRAPGRPISGAGPGDALGSTTHITAVDSEGRCASVTCSNGTGSGLFVPGTGIHVNNMLGEQDLNPFGYHTTAPGRRMPSMMSPTVVLSGEELEAGLGSGGSNRIRSAIVQTILRLVADRMPAQGAVAAPRVHVEDGIVHAEPGIDGAALDRLGARGYEIVRWRDESLYFGGVHTVARDAETGRLAGGGDPRRGGAVAVA